MTKNPWDNLAKEYNQIVQDTGDLYHKTYLNPIILKSLSNIKNIKILDLACGNGYFTKILAKKGAKATGADYSKELISMAKKNQIKNTKFLVESSSNLKSLKNNSFNFIVSNMAFHDIKNISGTIKECSRLLKPKSKLIFSIPHPAFYLAEKIKQNGKYHRKVIRYMSTPTLKHPHFKEASIYPRPIEYYLKLLFKNNFVISGFHEITTKHRKGKILKNSIQLKHKQEIPSFLIMEATLIK